MNAGHLQRHRVPHGLVLGSFAGAAWPLWPAPALVPAARAAARWAGVILPAALGQRGQGQLGIRDHADVHRMVLGDLVGVQVDVDDLRAWREDVAQLREYLRHDVGADYQD